MKHTIYFVVLLLLASCTSTKNVQDGSEFVTVKWDIELPVSFNIQHKAITNIFVTDTTIVNNQKGFVYLNRFSDFYRLEIHLPDGEIQYSLIKIPR